MGLSLSVGRLPGDLFVGASVYLSRASDATLTGTAQAELLKTWDAAPEEVEHGYFDALNEASWTAFLDHTARLEGLRHSGEAMTLSRWKHLPYWVITCWLPVRSTTTYEESMFVGSAHTLLANLADVRTASPYDLGVVPPYFELMRTDPKAFYRLRMDAALDDKTALQWVWRSFFEAASLCIERNVPMWCGG
jgi:hypothetical protein